jgi:nicotinamidase-related amidase
MSDQPTVELTADPFPFVLQPSSAALIVIDMQRDFLEPGGFGASLGNDVSQLRTTIDPIRAVLSGSRQAGMTVVHTREGHLPDLSDCPPAKRWRGSPSLRIGDVGPNGRILIRGEAGHDIIPEVAPVAGEPVIDKPGKGAFYATELSSVLESRGIRQLVVAGVTTEVCVHTTVREANDRGYECLLLEDCTGATEYANYLAALEMVKMQGGVFGAVATSDAFVAALDA